MKKIIFLLAIIIYIFACKKKELSPVISSKSDLDKGESFAFKNNDSAFYYLNKATSSYKDSLEAAIAYNYMAAIQTDAGDYFGAQESLLSSLKFLNEKKSENFACLASDYNELGLNNFNLKNCQAALTYYSSALKYSTNNDFRLTVSNNKALVYQELKKYDQAIKIYDSIIPQIKKDKIAYARALTNISFTKWLKDPSYNPEPTLLIALNIREKENNDFGRNSSYAHLADYYLKRQPDKALFYARKMYEVAQKIKSPDDQLQALQKLIKLSPQKESRQYFEIYQNLNDSLQTARSTAKNQFALIRYETEKNKADFLKAQEENIKKQNSIVIGYIGISILITFSIASYFWNRRRQKILKQEKEIEVKNTEIKYAKKVHDHVANRIYQVMDEIDNRPQMDKDEVAEKLDVIYHISRDLSYEDVDTAYKPGFAKALSKMFSSYQSARLNIVVNGNEEQIWEPVQETVKAEVFTILQELMTNMRKHSEADMVQLAFQQDQQRITILYSDNGKGIQHFSPGNGLKNTETRIKNISGIITFGNEATQGLNVKLSFPI